MINIKARQVPKFIETYKKDIITSIVEYLPNEVTDTTDSVSDLISRIISSAINGGLLDHNYKTPSRYYNTTTNVNVGEPTSIDFKAFAIEILRASRRVNLCNMLFEPHIIIDEHGDFITMPFEVPQVTIGWICSNDKLRCQLNFPSGDSAIVKSWSI